ncbi:MAG TPA: hypothetical protein VGJ70_14550 [Solirubrobacteraceae bacterium]
MSTRSALRSVALATACVALAATAEAQADSVVGTGKPSALDTFLRIDAHSGPSGEAPTGFAETQFSGGRIPVTCLSVAGNRAVVGVAVAGPQSTYILIVDNGATGDIFAGSIVTGDPSVCPAPSAFVATIGPSPLDSGDYVVVDDRPLPTANGDCKDGRWRDFGATFRNQGQCVAFVERGPNP